MSGIVQIASASTGGIGRLSRDISDVLYASGIDNYICYGRGQIFNSKRDHMFGSKVEVYVHALMTRFTDRTGFYSSNGTKELLKFLDEVSPDLIQIHNLHGYYINIQMLFDYIKKKNIPVVWTLHDCWAFTGHCTHFSLIGCTKWKSGCYMCPNLKYYPKTINGKNVHRNYQDKQRIFNSVEKLILVTPSEWLAKLAKESFLGKYTVKTIRNGIDLNIFRITSGLDKSKYGINNKKIILGVASSWSDKKGLSDFIRLSGMISDDFQIVLVGLSEKQLNLLTPRMVGITHTENAVELAKIYSEAFIFLNLTYEDNFPTTNIEAMACGTSVLTYNTGGSPESITKGSGYIVDQGDLKTVITTIESHEKNENTIQECVNNAMIYDKKICFENYKKLYMDLIGDMQ